MIERCACAKFCSNKWYLLFCYIMKISLFQIFVGPLYIVKMYKMHILCSIQVLKDQGATMRDSVAVNKEFMETNVSAVVMTLQSLPVDVNLWGENSEPYISDWDLTITMQDYLAQSMFFLCRLICRSRNSGRLTYNTEECLPCFCSGHSNVCSSAEGYSIRNITSTFENGELDV